MDTCMWVRKRRTWSCGVFLYFDYKRDREEQHAKSLLLFFYRWVDCSTVKDGTHTLWRYIYLYRHVSTQIFSWPEATGTENTQNVCHLFRCTDYWTLVVFTVLVLKLPTSMLFFIPSENLTTKLNLRVLLSLSQNSPSSLTFGYF